MFGDVIVTEDEPCSQLREMYLIDEAIFDAVEK